MKLPFEVQAGELIHEIVVYGPPATEQTDAAFQPLDAGDVQATHYAAIDQLAGAELVYAGQVQSKATHAITIRAPETYTPDATMWTVWKGKRLSFERAWDVEERGRKLRIWAESRQA